MTKSQASQHKGHTDTYIPSFDLKKATNLHNLIVFLNEKQGMSKIERPPLCSNSERFKTRGMKKTKA